MLDSSINIQRLVVRAKPAKGHPEYREWETASLVVLVAENDRTAALQKGEAELHRRKWVKLHYESKSTLIRDRVKSGGGEFWDAYKSAQRDGIYFRVFPDNFSPGKNGIPPMSAPRITEKFMDCVVEDAGGRRISVGQNRTTDYLLDDWLLELKDLQEEGLDQGNRQQRLASLFSPYFPQQTQIELDPTVLSDEDQSIYIDIMGSPIKSQIKSASKQIKSTRNHLAKDELKGGLIYLNTGYGSLPPDVFEKAVERYANKDSKQFEAVMCISTWSYTNGFESEAHYQFYPPQSKHPIVERIFVAFNKRFENAMTDIIRGKISVADLSDPVRPSGFVSGGIEFFWEPPKIPRSWLNEKQPD